MNKVEKNYPTQLSRKEWDALIRGDWIERVFPKRRWKGQALHEEVGQVIAGQGLDVFSAGACNRVDEFGTLVKNEERESINNFLSEEGYSFFDPELDPWKNYTSDHAQAEQDALLSARVILIQFSENTFGGTTALEMITHLTKQADKPLVLYFSDDSEEIFTPLGLDNQKGHEANFEEMIRTANSLRKNLVKLMRQHNEISTIRTYANTQHSDRDKLEKEGYRVFTISNNCIHSADIINAYHAILTGQKVVVDFETTEDLDDSEHFPAVDMDQFSPTHWQEIYTKEGKEMRTALAKIIDVYKRWPTLKVAYDEQQAIDALSFFLKPNITSDDESRAVIGSALDIL